MDPALRAKVLRELPTYWSAPVNALREDISDHFPEPEDSS
jgi:hypothetical protein